MTMGDFYAPTTFSTEMDDDDFLFMDQEKTFQELDSSRPSTSSITTSNESSRHNFSDEYDDILADLEPVSKRKRTEEKESKSPDLNAWDSILDGLDLPPSLVEKQKQTVDETKDKTTQPEDCHSYYGEIKWCDDIIAKFEAENKIDLVSKELEDEAAQLIQEHREEEQKRKLLHKKGLKEDKDRRRALSQANKEKTLFCCFICNKGFLSEESVQQHVNETHLRLDTRYPHKCKMCHMRFAHTSNLYRHQNTHQGNLYKCPDCPYQFKQQSSLDIHLMRDHASKDGMLIEESQCELCKANFATETEMKRHYYYCKNKEEITRKRKETREKDRLAVGQLTVSPAFSTGSAESSVSTGSGERPTKDKSCPYCLDVFASIQSRNRHIGRKHPERKNDEETRNVQYFKVDSPDLPYACQECGKRFASSASLSTHKKRIHEKKLDHVCDKCGKAYPLGSELRKHLRRVHNLTEVEAQDMTTF